ncbi:MAG: DUF1013 domain-containing protein, partial [Caulobacteraceae bacterium]|nr:DUF1013 domain-containing protein [Caulobacteraceae bacterium]
WFVRNHLEVTDAQTAKALGTTKATIDQVRNRTHWNSVNIKPVDPVSLGLISQLELDALVRQAAERKRRDDARRRVTEPEGPTLASPVEAFEPVEAPQGEEGEV